MGRSVKIAISLPEDVLAAAESERQARGETRSELFCEAVQLLLRQSRERADIERYVQGYRDAPETAEEIAAAEQAAAILFAQVPWE